jgi:hypothetical protein
MESCEHQELALPEAVDEQQLEALFEPYGGVVGYRSMLRAALAKELEPVPLLNGGHKRVNVLQRNRILLRRAARARVRSCRIVLEAGTVLANAPRPGRSCATDTHTGAAEKAI